MEKIKINLEDLIIVMENVEREVYFGIENNSFWRN